MKQSGFLSIWTSEAERIQYLHILITKVTIVDNKCSLICKS